MVISVSVDAMGWLLGIVCAAYCFWDANERRMKNPWLWSVFGFFCNFFAMAILHGQRWLKAGEARSGGRGWDSCRWFAIFSTPFFFFTGLAGLFSASQGVDVSSEAAKAGAAVGMTLGIGMIFFLWIFVMIASILFGFLLKKDVKEVGPTGPLASRV